MTATPATPAAPVICRMHCHMHRHATGDPAVQMASSAASPRLLPTWDNAGD